jgi:hypothetical protein
VITWSNSVQWYHKDSVCTRILKDVYSGAIVSYFFVAAWFRDLQQERRSRGVAIIEVDLEFQIGLGGRANNESSAAGKVTVQIVAGVEHATSSRATRCGDAVFASHSIAPQREERLVVAGA